jgi:hypothetical protein
LKNSYKERIFYHFSKKSRYPFVVNGFLWFYTEGVKLFFTNNSTTISLCGLVYNYQIFYIMDKAEQ